MASKVDFDRKDLKEPDAFFETFGKAFRYLRDNRTQVIAAVAGVVAVFAGAVSWNAYRAGQADEAAAAFMRAVTAIQNDNYASAKAALANVESGSVYADLARLYEADVAVREERFAEALPTYEQLFERAPTSYIRQVAGLSRAFALEQLDRDREAAEAYRAVSELDGPYVEQALRGQLRSGRAAGDHALVAAAITALLEKYPESTDADTLSAELAGIGSAG